MRNIDSQTEEDEPLADEQTIDGEEEIELDDAEVKRYLDDIVELMFSELDECKKEGKQSPEVYSEEKVAKKINLVKKKLPKESTGNPDEVGSTTVHTKPHLYKCEQCQFETTNVS